MDRDVFACCIENNCNPQLRTNIFDRNISTTTTTTTTTSTTTVKKQNRIEIQHLIAHNQKLLVLMRGLPGSGKTTLAKEILDLTKCRNMFTRDRYNKYVFSTDDYFYDKNGKYQFHGEKLQEAHQFNINRVREAIFQDEITPIFIDNTNIMLEHMKIYVEMAVDAGYVVRILEAATPWCRIPYICSKRTVHDVPVQSIENMDRKYEQFPDNIDIAKYFKLKYPKPKKNDCSKCNVLIEALKGSNSSVPLEANDDSTIGMKSEDLISFSDHDEVLPNMTELSISVEQQDISQLSTNQIQSENEFLPKHKPNCPNGNPDFCTLREICPHIPIDSLWDLFIKCNSNSNWTIDILINDKNFEFANEMPVADYKCDCQNYPHNELQVVELIETTNPSNKKMSSSTESLNMFCMDMEPNKYSTSLSESTSDSSIKLKDKKLRQKKSEPIEIKNHLENILTFPDNDLSDHFRKIRDIRRGKFPHNNGIINGADTTATSCDSTNLGVVNKLNFNNANNNDRDTLINAASSSTLLRSRTRARTKPRNVVVSQFQLNSKTNNEDQDYDCDVDEADDDGDVGIDNLKFDEDDERFLDINLGVELATELENIFGFGSIGGTKESWKLSTKVLMKKSLARNLYLLLLESTTNQIEEKRFENIKNDEKLARSLLMSNEYPKFSAKIQNEWTQSDRDNENNLSESLLPDNLATKLSIDKLCDLFPNIQRQTLTDILAIHKDFTKTVDMLNSTMNENKRESEVVPEMEKYENVAATPEQLKQANESIDVYRNSAQKYREFSQNCLDSSLYAFPNHLEENSKTRDYLSFLSNAHLEEARNSKEKATNFLLEFHNMIDGNTLDLHYLTAYEAMEILDMFLDKNIKRVKTLRMAYDKLNVITGRGLHSLNGQAIIKHATKKRLMKRGITYHDLNPGLLEFKIFPTTPCTNEIA